MSLTTAEAAALLGLSERQLQHLAANNQIPGAKKFGSAWQFPPKPRVIRPKRGRPVKATHSGEADATLGKTNLSVGIPNGY